VAIVDREELGVFPVSMVHSALLIDIHNYLSPHLSYSNPSADYSGPRDDIIMFAHSVKLLGKGMIINLNFISIILYLLNYSVVFKFVNNVSLDI
jgi:hypothetical protein